MEPHEQHLDILPGHMREGMRLWVDRGISPGSFLMAVLSNDLMLALGKADDVNRHALFAYGVYLYNYAPAGCYGSPEKVREWAKHGGLRGLTEAA